MIDFHVIELKGPEDVAKALAEAASLTNEAQVQFARLQIARAAHKQGTDGWEPLFSDDEVIAARDPLKVLEATHD